jgi:ribose-phosphate pyrophosphokinase
MFENQVKVFATSGSDVLAEKICESLRDRLPNRLQPEAGLELSRARVDRFSNENLQVQVENVRGYFVVIVHTQTPPVSDNLIELFALLDAVQNASPADVLLVLPYMPYARSDRKNQPRISVMAPLLAKILSQQLKVKRVLLLDPHDSHTKNYFEPHADDITAIYLLADYLERYFFDTHPKKQCTVVFADAGSAKRFDKVAHLLHLPIAYIDKDRPDDLESPLFKKVVGDIKDRTCILIDDEILTGNTSIGDAQILIDNHASEIIFLAVHGVLANKKETAQAVVQKLHDSPIKSFIITDSIPLADKVAGYEKFTVLSVAPLLAEAIRKIVDNQSLSSLYDPTKVKAYRDL